MNHLHGWARAAGLALLCATACGSVLAQGPRPLSDVELSDVRAQGLDNHVLAGLGVIGGGSGGQDASDKASQDAARLAGTLGLTALVSGTESSRELERQMARQQLQLATTGVQLGIANLQTLSAIALFSPVPVLLPVFGLPLFGLPLQTSTSSK